MPVVTKQDEVRNKGRKSAGRMAGRKKVEGGAKYPTKPASRDGQYEGTTGGQSKSLPQM